jgi:hypothetical protein
VQRHTKGLDNDIQVTNEKIGQLEATQITTNTKLMGLEIAVSNIDKSLAALLRHFDELHAKTNEQCDDWKDEYIAWEIIIDQKFACHDFPENACVRAATSEFTDFASIWWIEHGKKNTDDMPQTWDALKRVMRVRFVPSYYACDLLHKLQQLRQGTKSVEEYYQELHMGMLRCNLVEGKEPALARFLRGLNQEI